MTPDPVAVTPETVDLADATLSAVVRVDGPDPVVTVVISRPADQPPLHAPDVTAQLIDVDGRSLVLVDRDRGALVEAGGSLGMSVNAEFRFAGSDRPLARLTVDYLGTAVEFAIGT